jgi:putative copper resistance protein D
VRRLRISIGLELLAGFALLGLVAAMGVQMPPASM